MEIIAITNLNILTILLVKKFLLANSFSNSSISCLSFKSTISLSHLYWDIYSFNVSGADNKDSSNFLLFKKTGKVNSEVDLLVNVGIFISSVSLKSLIIDYKIHY